MEFKKFVLLAAVSITLAPASLGLRASNLQQATPQRVARPFPSAQYLPDHDFDTRHIALNLTFDWEREQVIGTETIILAPLVTNLARVDLDAANMTFSSVKLSSGTPLKYETDVPNQNSDHSRRAYQPRTETLSIEYVQRSQNGSSV